MTRIMFVCHGNICRSPMAEFIFRDLAKKRGVDEEFVVSSSATTDEEIWNGVGNPVYPPARAMLEKHGISCEGKRAVRLTPDDYGKYDLFIGMDEENMRDMARILRGDPQKKIRRMMEYTPRGGDVADPWYSNRFDTAYNDIFEACTAILDLLAK